MIANGGSYRCVWWWADHLQSKDNDRATVVKSYGLRSENIHDMLSEMEAQAQGTRCENFFYQMNLNPVPGEKGGGDYATQWRQTSHRGRSYPAANSGIRIRKSAAPTVYRGDPKA